MLQVTFESYLKKFLENVLVVSCYFRQQFETKEICCYIGGFIYKCALQDLELFKNRHHSQHWLTSLIRNYSKSKAFGLEIDRDNFTAINAHLQKKIFKKTSLNLRKSQLRMKQIKNLSYVVNPFEALENANIFKKFCPE